MSFAIVHTEVLLAWLWPIALAVIIIPGVAGSRVTRPLCSGLAGVMVALGMQDIVGAFRMALWPSRPADGNPSRRPFPLWDAQTTTRRSI